MKKIIFKFFHTSHFVTRQSSSINPVSFLYLIEYDWLSRHKWNSCSEFCPQTIQLGCWSEFYDFVLLMFCVIWSVIWSGYVLPFQNYPSIAGSIPALDLQSFVVAFFLWFHQHSGLDFARSPLSPQIPRRYLSFSDG